MYACVLFISFSFARPISFSPCRVTINIFDLIIYAQSIACAYFSLAQKPTSIVILRCHWTMNVRQRQMKLKRNTTKWEYTTNEIILFLVKASFFLLLLLYVFVLAYSILTCTNNGEKMKSLTINFEYAFFCSLPLLLLLMLHCNLIVYKLCDVNMIRFSICDFRFLSYNFMSD